MWPSSQARTGWDRTTERSRCRARGPRERVRLDVRARRRRCVAALRRGHGSAAGDRAGIEQSIAEEVLKLQRITFQSSQVQATSGGSGLNVRGDLTLLGTTHPIEFDIEVDEAGKLSCVAVVKQSDWGIEPYSGLFGALKVLDEVEVEVEGYLPDRET